MDSTITYGLDGNVKNGIEIRSLSHCRRHSSVLYPELGKIPSKILKYNSISRMTITSSISTKYFFKVIDIIPLATL